MQSGCPGYSKNKYECQHDLNQRLDLILGLQFEYECEAESESEIEIVAEFGDVGLLWRFAGAKDDRGLHLQVTRSLVHDQFWCRVRPATCMAMHP